jgi:hypothetical protein
VDDSDPLQSRQEGLVDELLDFVGGLVGGLADDVDFGAHVGVGLGYLGGVLRLRAGRLRKSSARCLVRKEFLHFLAVDLQQARF